MNARTEAQVTHGYCDACREESAITSTGRCLWCGGPTRQRPRRGGWKRPDLRGSRYTEAQLRALHVAHMRGQSINSLARQTYEAVGYASHGVAATAISREWKRLGLVARDRIEQTVLSSTKHGRKRRNVTNAEQSTYRRWLARQRGWNAVQGPGQPRCAAVKRQPPRKGERCRRPAIRGSEFCASHDPVRELARQAHLARMRKRRQPKAMVPIAPLVAWIAQRRERAGSLRALADEIGIGRAMLYRYAKGTDGRGRPKHEIRADIARRIMGADFEAFYEAEAAA